MTRQNNTSSRIIPVSWLLPSIGVCLVGAALCVPGKVELLQRLQADGNKSSVEEMAAEARKNKGVEDMTQATDRQKLRHWLTNPDNSVRTDPAIQLDTINMCAASLSPGELADEVLAHGDAIPQELRDKLLAGMASGVIGRGGVPNIAAGADIYTRWCRLAPSWALATQAAEAWMWAGKPAGASAIMEFMASREPGLEGAPVDLAERRIELAMAAQQPEVAFGVARDSFYAGDATTRPALLTRALGLAQHCAEVSDEAGKLIATHLSGIPYHTVSLERAAEMFREKKAFPDPASKQAYVAYAGQYAHLLWSQDKGDLAFDIFLRTGLLGDEAAWEICGTMCDDLLREADFTLILKERIDAGLGTDETPRLAELLAVQGDSAASIQYYRQLLAREREPWERWHLLEKYSEILTETGDYAAAAGALSEVLKLQPDAHTSRRQLAYCYVRMGRFNDARIEYGRASEMLPEDEALHLSYAGLCESTGHFSESIVALRRVMAAPHHNTMPDDFLQLADAYRITGDTAQQTAMLEQGLRRFTTSPRLRLVLAETFAAEEQHQKAVELLAHETLRDDPAAVQLLISEASVCQDPAVALAFFADKAPACVSDQPVQLLSLAFFFEQSQRIDAAETLFQGLLGNTGLRDAGLFQQLARTSLDFGDANRAEAFQDAHLKQPAASTDSKAWRLLGDIYTAQQRPDEAGTAYQKAVESIRPGRNLAAAANQR